VKGEEERRTSAWEEEEEEGGREGKGKGRPMERE
jgi:hypothetical protein